MSHFIYATTNPGKVMEVSRHLGVLDIRVEALRDFGIDDFDVPETGTTLGENAVLKVRAYANALQRKSDLRGKSFVVVSDDTGLEIDGLGGEPGIHVRRWKGYRMTDDEIIDHALMRMRDLPQGKRGAQFRTVLAVGALNPDGSIRFEPRLFEGTLRGTVLEKPMPQRIEGFPFESLFYVPEWGMHLGAAHKLPQEEKNKLLSHRERAITSAALFLKEQMMY